MGADLCIIAVELRETKEQALARIERLDWSDLNEMAGRFEMYGVYFEDVGNEPELEGMKERLRKAVEVVYTSEGRDVTALNLDGANGREFRMTGGTSWGDEPSVEWDDFGLFHEFLCFPYWLDPNDPERIAWKAK